MVISATAVLSSPLLPIAAIFTSAKYSGKLRRHTARSACSPSLSSFPSFSLRAASAPRRARRVSQRGCKAKSDSYEASARKVYLCRERLTREMRDEMVSLKRDNKGLKRVPKVEAIREGLEMGERSTRRVYSSC
jgi:hypothetical protein